MNALGLLVAAWAIVIEATSRNVVPGWLGLIRRGVAYVYRVLGRTRNVEVEGKAAAVVMVSGHGSISISGAVGDQSLEAQVAQLRRDLQQLREDHEQRLTEVGEWVSRTETRVQENHREVHQRLNDLEAAEAEINKRVLNLGMCSLVLVGLGTLLQGLAAALSP